jgi:chaperonin GroES
VGKTFEPLYSQILVLEIDTEQSIDGIVLPETSKEDTKFGTAVKIGEGYVQPDGTTRPLRIRIGDIVAYGMYAGIPIQIEGVQFKLMLEGELLGRLKEKEDG